MYFVKIVVQVQIFKLDFREKRALNEKISLYIFDLFFHEKLPPLPYF